MYIHTYQHRKYSCTGTGPVFQWEVSVHFYYHTTMPRGNFFSKASSLPSVNRPFYVQFCVPPVTHQRFADIRKLNPWLSMRIPNQHTCSLNDATTV